MIDNSNEKEALDLGSKRMIMEGMIEQQETMLAERTINLDLLDLPERPPLPKNLISSLERSQKLLNQLKNISESNGEQI